MTTHSYKNFRMLLTNYNFKVIFQNAMLEKTKVKYFKQSVFSFMWASQHKGMEFITRPTMKENFICGEMCLTDSLNKISTNAKK